MFLGVAEAPERQDRVHHRRENRRQPFGLRPRPVQHPFFRRLERLLAERLPRQGLQESQQLVHPHEKVLHREKPVFHRMEERTALDPVRIELVQLFFRRQMGDRAEAADDGHRHDDGARPGAHLEHVERRPVGQQEDFRRNVGKILPGILAEHRQVELAVGVAARNSSQPHRGGPGLAHLRLVRGESGQLQTEVGLDRRRDIAGSARIDRPATVGQLPLKNVSNDLGFLGAVHLSPQVHQQVVITGHRGIDEELTHPVSLGFLRPEQIVPACRHGFFH